LGSTDKNWIKTTHTRVPPISMNQKLFEEQQALLDLYEKLDEAEEQSRPFREAINELRSRIHAKMPN
jgi:hypothetical protein